MTEKTKDMANNGGLGKIEISTKLKIIREREAGDHIFPLPSHWTVIRNHIYLDEIFKKTPYNMVREGLQIGFF